MQQQQHFGWTVILFSAWVGMGDLCNSIPGLQCFLHWPLAPEALVELSEDDSVWPGQSVDDRLRYAHVQFVKLCREQKIRLSAALKCGD